MATIRIYPNGSTEACHYGDAIIYRSVALSGDNISPNGSTEACHYGDDNNMP